MTAAQLHKYRYSPLTGTQSPIRLLQLHKDQDNNALPLLQALRERTSFTQDDWIWIDSICINQDDEDERAMQVQLMGRIYQTSKRTVVWLGDDESRPTGRALDILKTLAEGCMHPQSGSQELLDWGQQPDVWEDLARFFQHPWWTRAWTLQEFVLPPAPDFHCGDRTLGHHTFRKAMASLFSLSEFGIGGGSVWGVAWRRRRVRNLFAEPEIQGELGLIALLAFTGNYRCKDPRDRIYSLLGLARERDRAIFGPPDYGARNTAEAAYSKLVMNFVLGFGSLDIICFAQLFRPQETRNAGTRHWPSWVPDWRVQVQPLVVPLMVSQPSQTHIGSLRPLPWPETNAIVSLSNYAASGALKSVIRFNIPARILTCRGVRLDVIDGMTTGMFSDYQAHNSTRTTQSTSPVNTGQEPYHPLGAPDIGGIATSLADKLIQTLTLDRDSRYLEDWAPIHQFRAYRRGIVCTNDSPHTSMPGSRGAVDSSTEDDSRSPKLFLIRGQGLLDICLSIPPQESMQDDHQELSTRLLETIGSAIAAFLLPIVL
ncbi:hypothetical protein OQA88_3457 [Cercophora sp. LCS_1]